MDADAHELTGQAVIASPKPFPLPAPPQPLPLLTMRAELELHDITEAGIVALLAILPLASWMGVNVDETPSGRKALRVKVRGVSASAVRDLLQKLVPS